MNPHIKAKWLAALRSGDYAQTRNALRDRSGYCCLGVLCDVVGPSDWVELPGGSHSHYGHMSLPSAGLLAIVGVSDETARKLSSMNDISELNFRQIADWIEGNL